MQKTSNYEIGYHHHTRVVDAISCDGLAGCVCLHIIMMGGSSLAMILACCQVSSDVQYQVLYIRIAYLMFYHDMMNMLIN